MISTTNVQEIMTKNVITLGPNDTMDRVKEIFDMNNIHHIPIVKDDEVVGIISKTDYLTLLHGFTLFRTSSSDHYNDAILRSVLIKEVMISNVAKLTTDDTLEIAAGFFRENLFHALPVVDEHNQLKGIITTYDLLSYAYKDTVTVDA